MNILSVEDEPQLSRKIAAALQKAGHVVSVALDGLEGLHLAQTHPVDLVVLDVNLPGCDGFTILEALRKQGPSGPRVLMLTANDEVSAKVHGLRAGADDYLTKPFAMDELIARVEALGRRLHAADALQVLRLGDLWMDVMERKVKLHNQPVSLSPREFEVLQVLIKNPNRIFSRDELCERIWQREHEYDTRTVEIFIMRLRKKLEAGRDSVNIETVRGVGYRLVATQGSVEEFAS